MTTNSPGDGLEMWTIYERPKDYPNGYVTRRFVSNASGTEPDVVAYYSKNLVDARAVVPLGRARLPRFRDDDPCIVEVWL